MTVLFRNCILDTQFFIIFHPVTCSLIHGYYPKRIKVVPVHCIYQTFRGAILFGNIVQYTVCNPAFSPAMV
jgi:hypothetical protein